ncbi:MAG: DUF6178 family protein [Proteobacteria bacterium]|nr:DUF6178 family protein [Pseudomonadota bacterium]
MKRGAGEGMDGMPARLSRTTSGRLLDRILDTPDLPDAVRRLSPASLGALIERIGLEDSGELVAMATVEQLERIFDEDLWRNERPGEEERFDAERFALWLEILLEAGDEPVARRLAELPEELVTLALHRQVLVLDMDALVSEMTGSCDRDDVDRIDKALSGCLSEELDQYRIVSRRHDGWDAVLSAILALDRDQHDTLARVLERCAAMSAEHIEESGGLYEVLTSEEMLEGDVAAEREDRRAAQGHVAPSAAAAFLKLARTAPPDLRADRDPLTRAYFRELARAPAGEGAGPAPAAAAAPSDLVELLRSEGVLRAGDAGPLLEASPRARTEPLFVRALRRLAETEPAAFAERSEELAYLANVLAAGIASRRGRLRPVEALEAAIAAVDLGLGISLGRASAEAKGGDPVKHAAAALLGLRADTLFRLAWHKLHADIKGPTGKVDVDDVLDALAAR